jgi:hypothetical protein
MRLKLSGTGGGFGSTPGAIQYVSRVENRALDEGGPGRGDQGRLNARKASGGHKYRKIAQQANIKVDQ